MMDRWALALQGDDDDLARQLAFFAETDDVA